MDDGEVGVGLRQHERIATRALPGARNITKLMMVGRKMAVLGVETPDKDPTIRPNRMEWWHIVKPGSYSLPQVGDKLTYGTALCGKYVATNGYASDFTPPEGSICPRCFESPEITW